MSNFDYPNTCPDIDIQLRDGLAVLEDAIDDAVRYGEEQINEKDYEHCIKCHEINLESTYDELRGINSSLRDAAETQLEDKETELENAKYELGRSEVKIEILESKVEELEEQLKELENQND